METLEKVKPISVVKMDGTKEPFEKEKLKESLLHAGAEESVAEDILEEVVPQVKDGMPTTEIYHKAFDLLKSEERPVAMKYSIRHAVMQLGPSGFPFEKYVAEIFKAKGYETLTDQTVKGFCVPHEIDVVAWNKEKLIMVEAKFHNELGTKSDLKVVLYVKARFDDLKQMKFNFPPSPSSGEASGRELGEFWLVTNTKFSSTAIEYTMCQGALHLVGWNYPPKGNLHDLILEAKLHPITCLSSLSSNDKKTLLSHGTVLCKTLAEKPELLELAGLDKESVQKVLEEITTL